jgi:hypothetical protein
MVQVLWRLAEPIKLAKPEMLPDENGELTLQFPKETAAMIADVESRAKLLMQTLGSVAGTQNIDRIFRIPGTINLPNAKKLEHGRTACLTKSISFSSASHPFENFPKPKIEPKPEPTSKVDTPPHQNELSEKDFVIWLENTLLPDQVELITKSIWKGNKVRDRSAQFLHAVGWLKDKDWSRGNILRLFRKYPKGISSKYLNEKEGGSDKRLKTETERAFNKAIRDDGNDVESDKPDAAPPPKHLLDQAQAVFRKWLGDNYDMDALKATAAAAASERLTGDPLWLLLVSGAGNAKTETVQALMGSGAHVTSTIVSEGALLSASPKRTRSKQATGGLLRKIGDSGVWLSRM